jgi:formyl-CoA transferase
LQNLLGLGKDEIMYLKGEGIIAPQKDKAKADEKASDKVETGVRDPIDLGLKTQCEKPLEGLRVLEIGSGLAGTFCTSILGDFGAEVIKVERPGQGDLLRKLPPLYDGSSLWWKVENRNKKSITLDLKKSEAREILLKLAGLSDLIVECMKPGTMESFGLGYQELNKMNRKIILVRISGFGQYGPYRDRPSYDTVAQAIGGIPFLTGFPDGPPTRVGWDVAAYFSGLYGAIGALIALYYRDVMKTGEGQWIDLGLYEPLVRISYNTVPYYDKLGCVEKRMGNQFSSGAPIDFYKTKDNQWAVIIAGHDTVFVRIMKAMGMEEMASDPRFSNNAKRAENKDLVNGIVAHWVEKHTLKEVVDTLTAYEAPVSPIYSIKDIFEDPHFKARENIISVKDNTFGELKMQGVIPKLSLTPGKVESTGPSLGEHNEEIFKGLLSLKQYDLNSLKMEGVI